MCNELLKILVNGSILADNREIPYLSLCNYLRNHRPKLMNAKDHNISPILSNIPKFQYMYNLITYLNLRPPHLRFLILLLPYIHILMKIIKKKDRT